MTPRFVNLTDESMMLGSVRVLGMSEKVTGVMVDGVDHPNFSQNDSTFEASALLVIRVRACTVIVELRGGIHV